MSNEYESIPDWVPEVKGFCVCGHLWMFHALRSPHPCNDCLEKPPHQRCEGFKLASVEMTEVAKEDIAHLDRLARSLSAPQPAPKPGTVDVWPLVIEDMRQRDLTGRRKYGTPLQAGNGRDALVDAYQEALDLVVYLRQAIEERKG